MRDAYVKSDVAGALRAEIGTRSPAARSVIVFVKDMMSRANNLVFD